MTPLITLVLASFLARFGYQMARSPVLPRFARYAPRLTNAVDRVRAGEVDWFTKPVLDSYHTVWFELHEDLLATLGIERGEEPDGEVR